MRERQVKHGYLDDIKHLNLVAGELMESLPIKRATDHNRIDFRLDFSLVWHENFAVLCSQFPPVLALPAVKARLSP